MRYPLNDSESLGGVPFSALLRDGPEDGASRLAKSRFGLLPVIPSDLPGMENVDESGGYWPTNERHPDGDVIYRWASAGGPDWFREDDGRTSWPML